MMRRAANYHVVGYGPEKHRTFRRSTSSSPTGKLIGNLVGSFYNDLCDMMVLARAEERGILHTVKVRSRRLQIGPSTHLDRPERYADRAGDPRALIRRRADNPFFPISKND